MEKNDAAWISFPAPMRPRPPTVVVAITSGAAMPARAMTIVPKSALPVPYVPAIKRSRIASPPALAMTVNGVRAAVRNSRAVSYYHPGWLVMGHPVDFIDVT